MDVFNALQTSVSGLKAQSYSLNNISGNIANSQTTGYKRIDTKFVDLLSEQTPKREAAGSVAAFSDLTNSVQGNIAATGVGTNMALNGEGFFAVRKKTSDASGSTVFAGSNLYTRRGDFSLDKDGYLVNGAGSYLIGSSFDPISGQATSNGPLRIGNSILPAKPTTSLNYAATLPRTPSTAKANSTAGSELLTTAALPNSAGALITTGAGTGKIDEDDAQAFIDNSITGPSLTAYTSVGAPVGMQMRWAKIANADPANPASRDTWNLFYADKSTVAGSATSWTNVGQAFQFDANGKLSAPTGGSFTVSAMTIDSANLGNVKVSLVDGGLTQYSSVSGTVTTGTLSQDGYGAGSLKSLAVTEDGKITGTYSNGTTLNLATVEIVQFNNPDGLKADSLGNYSETLDSGTPKAGLNNTRVIGGNVEQSNTDIASEFSKMIVTQQAYSANTRVLSTAQTMISDLLNVIR